MSNHDFTRSGAGGHEDTAVLAQNSNIEEVLCLKCWNYTLFKKRKLDDKRKFGGDVRCSECGELLDLTLDEPSVNEGAGISKDQQKAIDYILEHGSIMPEDVAKLGIAEKSTFYTWCRKGNPLYEMGVRNLGYKKGYGFPEN